MKIKKREQQVTEKLVQQASILDDVIIRLSSIDKLMVSYQQKLIDIKKQQSEHETQISYISGTQSGHHSTIAELEQLQQEHANLLQLMQSQSTEQKLYGRAKKMIDMGADIDELINECEIPRAEAELLISLYRN